MRIASADIYTVRIPFVEAFSHSLFERDRSESVVVKLTTDADTTGFGEGAPRYYVTGETLSTAVEHIREELLPLILGVELGTTEAHDAVSMADLLLPDYEARWGVVHNAARCAVELALADCILRAKGASLGAALPAATPSVVYSGVIGSGSFTATERAAARFASLGFRDVKVKVGTHALEVDVQRVALVRDVMGKRASLRLDANGAYDLEGAMRLVAAVDEYGVDSVEQPLPRGRESQLAVLRRNSPVAIMVDESILTPSDAAELVESGACDMFNIRLSKCGGLGRSLAIAQYAERSGLGVQLGCQVGETAILSAAGRHFATHVPTLRFLEGSYGSHLLVEDVSLEPVVFGRGGRASAIDRAGLGVEIDEACLAKYTDSTIHVGEGEMTWAC